MFKGQFGIASNRQERRVHLRTYASQEALGFLTKISICIYNSTYSKSAKKTKKKKQS